MSNDHIRHLFDQAIGLPPDEREEYIRSKCDDPEVVREINALLAHHDAAEDLFERSAGERFDELLRMTSRHVEEFEIIKEIGRGGMGVVYLARDEVLGRDVALKVINPLLADTNQGVARFRQEAKTVAALNHPGIVPVYRYGLSDGLHFLVLEYVPGTTLKELLKSQFSAGERSDRTALSSEWIRTGVEISIAIGDALEHAHQNSVIHRDVKPGNVLIGKSGEVRLTDFGIAKFINGAEGMTLTEGMAGTPAYQSPEQVRHSAPQVDHRSDVFSLGVVLYELITGKRPFGGETREQVLMAIKFADPASPRSVSRDIDRDLDTICLKALEKDPVHRYQTAGHFVGDLRCFLRGDPVMARPMPIHRRFKRAVERNRIVVLVALTIVLLSSIVLMGLSVRDLKLERFAWVQIDTGDRPMTVSFRRVEIPAYTHLAPVVYELGPGMSPLRIEPGSYRITIQDASDSSRHFAELDVLLSKSGRSAMSVIQILDSSQLFSSKPMEGQYYAPLFEHDEIGSVNEMVLIDGGTYISGPEYTVHEMYTERELLIDQFYIDRAEVTNREYMAFLIDIAPEETGVQYLNTLQNPKYRPVRDPPYWIVPYYWHANGYKPELAEHPVVGITVNAAKAYASWCGKRLPTMHEWEAAAQGLDELPYPRNVGVDSFGAPTYEELEEAASRELEPVFGIYARGSVPVTEDPMPTKNGLYHTFGNVREMTSTINLVNGSVVLKGRCWFDFPRHDDLRSAWEYPSNTFFYTIGFRCARSSLSHKEIHYE